MIYGTLHACNCGAAWNVSFFGSGEYIYIYICIVWKPNGKTGPFINTWIRITGPWKWKCHYISISCIYIHITAIYLRITYTPRNNNTLCEHFYEHANHLSVASQAMGENTCLLFSFGEATTTTNERTNGTNQPKKKKERKRENKWKLFGFLIDGSWFTRLVYSFDSMWMNIDWITNQSCNGT